MKVKTSTVKVNQLQVGQLVDLSSNETTKSNPNSEADYFSVIEIEQETTDTTIVSFDNNGLSPGTYSIPSNSTIVAVRLSP